MNFKIGNDIIETERIKNLCEKYGDKFKERVYTNKEIEYCEKKNTNKYQSYAGRFAAKEAIFKAIWQRSLKAEKSYQQRVCFDDCNY